MFIFVTGGSRSGRSAYALRRAAELGPPPWLYVTNGEETDESVRKRIEQQRRDNEAIWRTAVLPADIRSLFVPPVREGLGAMVLDGFPGWLLQRLATRDAATDAALMEEVEEIADRLYRSPVPVILVSQEMGLGLPPEDPRQLREVRAMARANQIFTAIAGGVVFMVSGVPLKVR
jgi:adenosylcobinamide kinase / adenosylcobinamide-phosphate guanylyltransferase